MGLLVSYRKITSHGNEQHASLVESFLKDSSINVIFGNMKVVLSTYSNLCTEWTNLYIPMSVFRMFAHGAQLSSQH